MKENEKIIQSISSDLASILVDQGLNQGDKVEALATWAHGLVDGFLEAFADGLKQEEKREPDKKPHHWPGMYDPPNGGEYHRVIPYSGITKIAYNSHQEATDLERAMGICSETEEEAKFVKSQMEAKRDVVDLLKKLNAGWTPDWEDETESKFSPYLGHEYDDVSIIDRHTKNQNLPDCFQSKSEEVWNRVIEELGVEKVILAIWPEYTPTSDED